MSRKHRIARVVRAEQGLSGVITSRGTEPETLERVRVGFAPGGGVLALARRRGKGGRVRRSLRLYRDFNKEYGPTIQTHQIERLVKGTRFHTVTVKPYTRRGKPVRGYVRGS